MEDLKEILEKLKTELLNSVGKGIQPLTEETKKELIEKFTKEINEPDVRSVVYSVDGMIASVGSRICIMSDIFTIIHSAIDHGIFKDYDEFIEYLNQTKGL